MKTRTSAVLLAFSLLSLSGCWWQTPNQARRPAPLGQGQTQGQPPAQTAAAPGHSSAASANHSPPPVLVLPDLEPALPPPAGSVPVNPVSDPAAHGDHAAPPAGTATSSGSHTSGGGSSGHFSPPVSSHGHSSSGSSSSGHTTPQPQHHMDISEIVLTETGESILGPEALASIQGHYDEDHEVLITIRGNFNTAPAVQLEHMQFTLEPAILHLGLVGKEPPVRVTLDHTILLTPVSASATEIVASLNTRGIPDLLLKGLHTLTLAAGQLLIERKVKVGEPLSIPASLNPVIEQVEVLYDAANKPINLRLHGQHLMLQPKYSYAQVNGEFGFGHQTAVRVSTDTEGQESLHWQSIVHLPVPADFDPDATHDLMYITPFGATFTSFSGQGE